jgi:hypothetical protein
MLTQDPKIERNKNEIIKMPKKNTAFQNTKRILTKMEDEKHELDIKIIQFKKVNMMLLELKDLYSNDSSDNQGDESPDNENTNKKIEIEKKNDPEELNNMKKATKEIFLKYFKEKMDKIKLNSTMISKEKKKEYLINKIRRFKVLELIYDSNKRRKTKISQIILNNLNYQVAERVSKRVTQKLKILEKLKKKLSQTSWKTNLLNNYYKSLDVRSGSLQQNEKSLLSSKYFISNFLETERIIKLNEKSRYWIRVFKPEMSLGILSNKKNLNEMTNSEVINNSAAFTCEKGMYDSLIKLDSQVKAGEESQIPLLDNSQLVRSVHQLDYFTPDSKSSSLLKFFNF